MKTISFETLEHFVKNGAVIDGNTRTGKTTLAEVKTDCNGTNTRQTMDILRRQT